MLLPTSPAPYHLRFFHDKCKKNTYRMFCGPTQDKNQRSQIHFHLTIPFNPHLTYSAIQTRHKSILTKIASIAKTSKAQHTLTIYALLNTSLLRLYILPQIYISLINPNLSLSLPTLLSLSHPLSLSLSLPHRECVYCV